MTERIREAWARERESGALLRFLLQLMVQSTRLVLHLQARSTD